jgi:hypothetical protein
MAAITPSFTRVSPSYVMPEWILQYQQASGAFELLASGDPMIRLSEGDQYVYGKTLYLKTEIAVGQVDGSRTDPYADVLDACSRRV